MREQGKALQSIPEDLRSDETEVRAAVLQEALALECAAPSLRGKLDLVLPAVMKDKRSVRFVAHEVWQDEVFLRHIAQGECLALQHATARVRADKHIILSLERLNWTCLKHTASHLQKDRELASTAYETDPISLRVLPRASGMMQSS